MYLKSVLKVVLNVHRKHCIDKGNGNTTRRYFPYKYRTECNSVSVHIQEAWKTTYQKCKCIQYV